MSSQTESQPLVVPQHADYIYLNQVDDSEAHYVHRVVEFRGECSEENFLVLDHTGHEILLERAPVKHLGFARAWQAIPLSAD